MVGKVPFLDSEKAEIISELSRTCVFLCRQDWDDFEISYDFKKHPLCEYEDGRMEDAFYMWEKKANDRFLELKNAEEQMNELFIKIYGLENELNPNVNDEDISVRRPDLQREIKSFISYAVGCILGRYMVGTNERVSSEDEGLSDEVKICEYGVVPITEEQFFESDLCTRVIDFIRVVYGEDTLADNLKFIANALKPDSYDSPKKIIRDYLFNGFFDNHYQIYQHRPIYWQLDSGKAGGFRAIVYMHRFNENTLPLVRTEYIQDLRYKYEDEMQRQQRKLTDAKTTAEKNAVKKEISSLDKKMVECSAYDDLLNHVTGSIQNYVFDLDDGVKNNYAKFLSIDGDKNKNILTVIKL